MDTEPASPNNMAKGDPLNNKAKVIKQRPFLRTTADNKDFSPDRTGKQITQGTPLHIKAPYDEEEDIIEQTFGIGDDQRNNQVFQDLPTPKSRMKREIDIEKEITAGGGSGN